MTDSLDISNITLRQHAEKMVVADEACLEPLESYTTQKATSFAETKRLLHELQVHQIELEMQNHELCESRHELEASRERYFELFDMAPVGYLALDKQGNILEANLTVATLLGVSRGVLLNKPLSSYILQKDQGIICYQQNKLLLESVMPHPSEIQMVRADGSIFWVELKATPTRNDECWVVLADISRRKEAEEILHQQSKEELNKCAEQYRSMIATNLFGFWMVDTSGKLLDVNDTYCRMSGYNREELLQLSVPDIEAAESVEQTSRHLQKLLSVGVDHFESRHRAKDGRNFDVEISTAFLSSQGKCIVFIRDISERKVAESALQESRGKLKAYMDNSIDVIFALNAEAVFLFVSRAWERHFGYPIKEVLGKNFAPFVHPDDVSPCSEYLKRILNAGKSKASPPYRVKRSDGEWRWFIANGSRYLDTNNEWQFIGVAHDITDQYESEEELRRAKTAAEAANQAKSAFLATMSHEIRTPLNALLGNIELLAASQPSPQQQEHLKDCQTASHILLHVINDILDFSKIEAGKLELIDETFSVSSMGQAVLRIFAASAKEKGLDLTLSLADDLPAYISCDQHRLRQIISNLLSNAIKFTDHGAVSLEIGRKQPSSSSSPDTAVLLISLRDTGKGISLDKQASIFDSFTQVEEFNTRRHTGTGLGLAISLRLAEMMGGAISLSSAPDEGSLFTLSLPVTVLQIPAQEMSEKLAKSDTATSRNILLADDDELGRSVTAALLQRRGHRVTAVENGADLLEALQRQKFDIVLSDISMPDMDGMEVARIIRSGYRADIDALIPIIAMTAHAFAQDQARFLESGIDGYVSKPVNFEELLGNIDELCSMTDRR